MSNPDERQQRDSEDEHADVIGILDHEVLLARLQRFSGILPQDFVFDRQMANARDEKVLQ